MITVICRKCGRRQQVEQKPDQTTTETEICDECNPKPFVFNADTAQAMILQIASFPR